MNEKVVTKDQLQKINNPQDQEPLKSLSSESSTSPLPEKTPVSFRGVLLNPPSGSYLCCYNSTQQTNPVEPQDISGCRSEAYFWLGLFFMVFPGLKCSWRLKDTALQGAQSPGSWTELHLIIHRETLHLKQQGWVRKGAASIAAQQTYRCFPWQHDRCILLFGRKVRGFFLDAAQRKGL